MRAVLGSLGAAIVLAMAASPAAPADLIPPGGEEPAGFVTVCGDQLCLDGEVFRFVSFNAPELSMRENPYWDVEAQFDQEDIIRTVAEFGGRVTRTYVLSVAGTGKSPVHVEAPGQYGEEAFQSLDRVLALANRYDVKVIVPFIDTWEWWGGIPQFSAMHGVPAEEFYTSEVTRQAYKDLVHYVLNRRNSVTGVLYKDDPAVLAWETGNELRRATTEWTLEMAAYLKSLGPKQLVLDGNDEERDPRVLDDPNIDFLTRHYYGQDFRQRFLADLEWAGIKKPMIVGEFGLASFAEIEGVVNEVVEQGTTGALIWSLRNHDSNGGWHWHCESGGTCAYHWPGFESGTPYDEDSVLDLLHAAAWAVRGEAPPAPSVPDVPHLLPITTPLDIQWRGVVGADRYDIERSRNGGTSWEIAGTDITDSTNAHLRRVLRTLVDPQSGRTHEAALTRVLFQDTEPAEGEVLLYRIRAKGPGGVSDWSEPERTVVSLIDGLFVIDDDVAIADFKTIARFATSAPITRIELLTDGDAVTTDSVCFPKLVSGKTVLEVNIVDAPEVNPRGAVVVTADGIEIGQGFAIAQPCRGTVNILALRYSTGSYDLDAPRVPPRELPFPVIDLFEGYEAGGLGDKWKPHPSGNKTSFAVVDGTEGPHLAVDYELGSPNYSGIQRFLVRDNWRAYEGIRFRYRGAGGAGNLTPQFRNDSGYWETNIPAPPSDWTEVEIPFTAFTEPPWSEQGRTMGLTGTMELNFYVGGAAGGTYEIDDIELYRNGE
jgi:hypothetical protein